MATLRETAARCRKKIHIGAAVLPRPLFVPDAADHDDDDGDFDPARAKIPCATIASVDDADLAAAARARTDGGNGDDRSSSATTRYARVLSSEFNAIVVEHHLKWTPLTHTQPGPIDQSAPPSTRLGRYDFHHADTIVDWALGQGMEVKGHVLVWHVTSPPHLEDLSPPRVREEMARHIRTTMAHFRGRIRIWDVVNESLAPDGTVAQNVFYRKLGPGYIDDAFRIAHEADPDAFLIYNDNKVEGCGPGSPNVAKADGFYDLLRGMVERGVPVHGAGMQAHFAAGGTGRSRPPTPGMVRRQIRRIGELGLRVNVSEMDVRTSKLPPDPVLRARAQRQIYRDIAEAALSEPAFDGIWLWGFTDRHTWVKNFYSDDEPLVFDENYERKECYFGLREAIESICPGGVVGGGSGGRSSLEADVDEEGRPWGYEWMQPEPDDAGGGVTMVTSDGRPDWLQLE